MVLHHTSILTGSRDLAAACERFYIENFGMGIALSSVAEMSDYSFYADSLDPTRSSFEIIGKSFDEREHNFLKQRGPGLDHICFAVKDLQPVYETMTAKGVRFHVPPYWYENFFIAWCHDPCGVEVELLQTDFVFPEAQYEDTGPKAFYHHVAIVAGNRKLASITEDFYRRHIGLRQVSTTSGRTAESVYLEDASSIHHPWLSIIGRPQFQTEKTFYMQKGSGIEHIGFGVENVDQYFRFLQERDVRLASGIIFTNDDKMFFLYDPAGTCVQVLEIPGF